MASDSTSSTTQTPSRPPQSGRRIYWLLGLLVLGGAVLLWRSGPREPPVPQEQVTEPPPPVPVPTDPSLPAPIAPRPVELVERELPDGTVIRVALPGVESELIAYIADVGRPVDDALRFTLDRVGFERGSADLSPGSAAQIDNLVAMMKAWPFLKLQFVGHGDEPGSGAADLELAGQRATRVMNEVVGRGVAAERVRAESDRDQSPKAMSAFQYKDHGGIDVRVTAK